MKHKRSLISIAMATLVVVSLCAVCASTSVSAAPSSSANAETSAGLVGAPAGVVGAPAVCSQAANSLDLFVRGTDNALWWAHVANGQWSAWQSLGGKLTADPAAVYLYDVGEMHVFVRGGDGALWWKFTWNGGTSWSAWSKVGGQLLPDTGPSAICLGMRMDIYVTGMDHSLWQKTVTYNGETSTWSYWRSFGGYLTSSPAAQSFADTIDVLARGGDGALWDKLTRDNGASWAWYKIGGGLLAGTGPTSGAGVFRFFVTGNNHALYYMQWGGTQGWQSLGGYLTSSPAAASHSFNAIDVFARGGDGDLWSRWTGDEASSWSPWYEIIGPST